MKHASKEISKQLAKMLDENGYVWKNKFAYYSDKPHTIVEVAWANGMLSINSIKSLYESLTPSFTMCELWDMLPESINEDYLEIWKDNSGAVEVLCYYPGDSIQADANPCNALAKLAIWCVENGRTLNLKKKDQ